MEKTALITAHGQPSEPGPPEQALAELAQAVSAYLPGWEVRSATLSTPGRLESQAVPGAVLYPFFMARGWFTAQVLPERLRGIPARTACPFGLDPGLPELAARAIAAAAAPQGWTLRDTHVFLAAHGSARGPRAAQAAGEFARNLRALLPGSAVSLGYVEQSPRLAEAARHLPRQTVCLPCFAQAGGHVKHDLPAALNAAGFAGITLPVAGSLPGVPALIARAIRTAAAAPQG